MAGVLVASSDVEPAGTGLRSLWRQRSAGAKASGARMAGRSKGMYSSFPARTQTLLKRPGPNARLVRHCPIFRQLCPEIVLARWDTTKQPTGLGKPHCKHCFPVAKRFVEMPGSWASPGRWIRTMPAAAPATVAPAQMILCFEHNQTRFIEVKVTRLRHLRSDMYAPTREGSYTIAANARPVPHLKRHPCQKLIRNLRLRAPARPFVRFGRTMPAIVCLPA
jgi:hypothetical protein